MKNIKYLLSFFFLLIFLSTSAQNTSPKKQYHRFEKGENSYIISSKANVRDAPSIEIGKVINRISVGTKVLILEEKKETHQIRNFKAHWYKVQYDNNKEGYIWGGIIADGAIIPKDKSDELILYGVASYDRHVESEKGGENCEPGYLIYYTYDIHIKLCKLNQILAQENIAVQANGKHSINLKKNKTIAKIDAILVLSTKSDELDEEFFIFWKKNNLKFIGKKSNYLAKKSNPCIHPHPTFESKDIFFPKSLKSDTIIKYNINGFRIDLTTIEITEESKDLYRWDGVNLIPLDNNQIKPPNYNLFGVKNFNEESGINCSFSTTKNKITCPINKSFIHFYEKKVTWGKQGESFHINSNLSISGESLVGKYNEAKEILFTKDYILVYLSDVGNLRCNEVQNRHTGIGRMEVDAIFDPYSQIMLLNLENGKRYFVSGVIGINTIASYLITADAFSKDSEYPIQVSDFKGKIIQTIEIPIDGCVSKKLLNIKYTSNNSFYLDYIHEKTHRREHFSFMSK